MSPDFTRSILLSGIQYSLRCVRIKPYHIGKPSNIYLSVVGGGIYSYKMGAKPNQRRARVHGQEFMGEAGKTEAWAGSAGTSQCRWQQKAVGLQAEVHWSAERKNRVY